MKTFKDIEFKTHPHGGGWAGVLEFENKMRLSVVCGEFAYCEPKINLPSHEGYKSFEIAIMDSKGDWATKTFVEGIEDNVIGWQDKATIEKLISEIETYSEE